MATKKKTETVIATDPLERAAQILGQMDDQFMAALAKVTNAKTAVGVDGALAECVQAYRIAYSMSHAIASATGKNIYKRRWTLDRMFSPMLETRWNALRRGLPNVALPPEATQVISQLEALKPENPDWPRTFQGEAEWQQHLRSRGLVEASAQDGYKSLSKPFESNSATEVSHGNEAIGNNRRDREIRQR